MKDKQTFFQNEPGWVIESSFICFAVFGTQAFGLFFLLTECFFGFPNLRGDLGLFLTFVIILLFVPLIMYPEAISRFSWNIHIDKEKVWVNGDKIALKWFRIQLPVKVYYSEIVAITIEHSVKNSAGQSIRTWFYGPIWSKKRYLTLKTEKGQIKRLHVTHFTDALLAEIIDSIAERCERASQKYDGRRAAQILFNL
ncbi:MAG: hypothetical protein IJS37_00385 [Bacilli bacterium]|nr:hypothetical protein [Bacilli bacterium]